MTGETLIKSIHEFGKNYNKDAECIIRIKDGDSYKDYPINKIFADGRFHDHVFDMTSIVLYSKGEED